jgi:glycogen debranching enzyme
MEDEQYYALALDADKRQVQAVTSNAGHCLWSGICDPEKVDAVARRLVATDMFSGWGVRTLSKDSPNYNPMSYHNGSVWPHDTAIIALGLRCSGYAAEAIQLVRAVIEAGFRFSDARLPELFCGFERDRRFNSSPAAYVVSCSPQAWSACCVFMLLQCILDIHPEAGKNTFHLDPVLPDLFRRLSIQNLRLGSERFDLLVEGEGADVQVRLKRAEEAQLSPVTAGK